ncbi:hypothetical protein A7U60_g1674 [Sanghuangporus baumii]|uniref:RING-type domain-containing protein n=1 Tax=Sanghuangporus baumii TaxID=108892 RepID=A0A9Q5I411_SANBA|nr:hypothetical protein A7U60_g1674 [Sanghuangporus baumii]
MGQSPSSQNAHYLQKQGRQIYEQADPFIIATSASSTSSIPNGRRIQDPGLADSAKQLLYNGHHRDVRNARLTKHGEQLNESDRAHFCLFCDRSFERKNGLQEHLTVHDPAYRSKLERERARGEERQSRNQQDEVQAQNDLYSFCRVCNKDFRFQPERLLNHHILAEKHRNVRSRRELHPTNNRPELWCALCETRFTHTDGKRKHMLELNDHNIRYRELEAQALRVPNFDRSILERPSPEVLSAMADSSRSQRPARTGRGVNANASVDTSVRPGPRARIVNERAGEESSLHYCAPCDRYFLSAQELVLHQSEERCTTPASDSAAPIDLQPPGTSDGSQSTTDLSDANALRTPPPTNRIYIPAATQSMYNLTIPIPMPAPTATPNTLPELDMPTSPLLPPFPPPPYELEDSSNSLSVPVPSSSNSDVPPRPPESIIATSARMVRALPAQPSVQAESSSSSSAEPEGPGMECSLCLEREDNLSSLACGHIFGTECIRDTLKEDLRCPICREPAALTDLRRVFLS